MDDSALKFLHMEQSYAVFFLMEKNIYGRQILHSGNAIRRYSSRL